MSERRQVPPGWPQGVPPPQVADWAGSAVSWLLDQCPADYRGYPVLSRHPLALAHLAAHHVEAQVHANQRALATARVRLRDLPAPALADVVEVLEVEQARLQSVARSLALVGEALRRAGRS
jgi:hypothetical protein